MMYLILSGIFAASSLAQTPAPLLTLDQYSGFTAPQNAMEAHCIFEPFIDMSSGTAILTGHTVAKIYQDRTGTDDSWKTELNIEKILAPSEFTEVLARLKEAEAGPYKQGKNPSDIGTVIIKTPTYPLLISQDGGRKVENQNPASAKLITWFRQACQLQGKKR